MLIHDAVSTVQKTENDVKYIRLQHYDVITCKQRHLKIKHHWCIGVSICYNNRKFGKVFSINEGVIAFSKKVHVFFRHPVLVVVSQSSVNISHALRARDIYIFTTYLKPVIY